MSFPSPNWDLNTSFPASPNKVSDPLPPFKISLPAPPLIVLTFASPVNVSLFEEPIIFSKFNIKSVPSLVSWAVVVLLRSTLISVVALAKLRRSVPAPPSSVLFDSLPSIVSFPDEPTTFSILYNLSLPITPEYKSVALPFVTPLNVKSTFVALE